MKNRPPVVRRTPATVPAFDSQQSPPAGSRTKLLELGPEKFAATIRANKSLGLTDTTMRDAHQSLLATRMRSYDMIAVADAYEACGWSLFT